MPCWDVTELLLIQTISTQDFATALLKAFFFFFFLPLNIDFRAETATPLFAFPKNLTSSSPEFLALPIDRQNVQLPFAQFIWVLGSLQNQQMRL